MQSALRVEKKKKKKRGGKIFEKGTQSGDVMTEQPINVSIFLFIEDLSHIHSYHYYFNKTT